MLSDNNIRKINDQIKDELRTVDRAFVSHQEKMEALERIAALKALLDPPVKNETSPSTQKPADVVVDFSRLFRRS